MRPANANASYPIPKFQSSGRPLILPDWWKVQPLKPFCSLASGPARSVTCGGNTLSMGGGRCRVNLTLSWVGRAPRTGKTIGCGCQRLSSLDPKVDETPEQAKTRYLAQVNGSASAIIDSGNGIQVLRRRKVPIQLNNPEQDQDRIADAEARMKAWTLALGGTAGTQNIDRILRLPG